MEQTGRLHEAIDWYQRAAVAGDLDALLGAAELLERDGRMDELVRLRQYGLEPDGQIAKEWN
jgi:hypothetical protein